MFSGLKDAAAIVTGAAGGMGTATTLRLAREGCRVFAVDISQTSLQRLMKDLAAEGLDGMVTPWVCDSADEDAVNRAVAKCIELYGKVTILVNIAGIYTHYLLKDMPTAEWNRMMEVNLTGVMYFCRAVLDNMIENRYGKIINMASHAGVSGGTKEHTHYSASKAAVIGMSRCLANEVAEYGISVNCIAPGWIDTPMSAHYTPERKAAILEKIPMGRFGLSDEVARVIEFLASDGSNYMTGQVYNVTGGFSKIS